MLRIPRGRAYPGLSGWALNAVRERRRALRDRHTEEKPRGSMWTPATKGRQPPEGFEARPGPSCRAFGRSVALLTP